MPKLLDLINTHYVNEEGGCRISLCLRMNGVVQGVGFRPFIYTIAQESGVFGCVRNDCAGVLIELSADLPSLKHFATLFDHTLPPLAVVESIAIEAASARPFTDFKIDVSNVSGILHTLPPTDAAICAQCRLELFSPNDRRYRYPFINCTHCGPRYSIINKMPYDRPNTSMAHFQLCSACYDEYNDPSNRRFHAQPIACPICGPQIALWNQQGTTIGFGDDALNIAVESLKKGEILAVKGLGGFHLMADAMNEDAVQLLRVRKHRSRKPFAIMYPDLDAVRVDCSIDSAEAAWLQSPIAPIVLLHRHAAGEGGLASNIAPDCHRIGAMLPYTPLHQLLCHALKRPLIATSGNLSEEPICYDESEALHRLRNIADTFLVHNRPIVRPLDDSIMQVVCGQPMVLRAARGIAPYTIQIDSETDKAVFAVGAHQKNTVALAGRGHIICSQHIGDLDTEPSRQAFESVVADLQEVFDIQPAVWVGDIHQDYASSQWLEKNHAAHAIQLQHHYAHVLSCMAEHQLNENALGIAWDGTGLGDDRSIWGGEALLADWSGYKRVAHLSPYLLPGGERAAREPWRSALGLLAQALGVEDAIAWYLDHAPDKQLSLKNKSLLTSMLQHHTQCVWTSSMGRLFDGIAAILGLSWEMDYEGEAAMRLEAAALSAAGTNATLKLPLLQKDASQWQWDWIPLIRDMIRYHDTGVPVGEIAWAFHAALANAVFDLSSKVCNPNVLLTGGCFQNALLLSMCEDRFLNDSSFTLYRHQWIPTNDGSMAAGQAAYAIRQFKAEMTETTIKDFEHVPGDTR